MSNSFSFLNETAIISYDEGVRQNRDKISSKIKNKITTGNGLTDTENVFVKKIADDGIVKKQLLQYYSRAST